MGELMAFARNKTDYSTYDVYQAIYILWFLQVVQN